MPKVVMMPTRLRADQAGQQMLVTTAFAADYIGTDRATIRKWCSRYKLIRHGVLAENGQPLYSLPELLDIDARTRVTNHNGRQRPLVARSG